MPPCRQWNDNRLWVVTMGLLLMDVPLLMDVGQVISGYELEGTLSAGGTIGNKTKPGAMGDFVSPGAGGHYLDRPTITGADFIETMMTPFPPGAIMFLVEAGCQWMCCSNSACKPSMACETK